MTTKNLQICGTSGTGKTTIVRKFMEMSNAEPIEWTNEGRKVTAYEGHLYGIPLRFLGSYEAVCGGCDTIPKVSIVADLLRGHSDSMDRGLIVYEGLMISHMLGTVGEAQQDLGLENNVRAYLDTPLSVCLERVQARRMNRGDHRPFNPNNTTVDWERVHKSRRRAELFNFNTRTIDYLNPINSTFKIIQEMCGELSQHALPV